MATNKREERVLFIVLFSPPRTLTNQDLAMKCLEILNKWRDLVLGIGTTNTMTTATNAITATNAATATNATRTLFCLVFGEDPAKHAFPVKIAEDGTVGELKKLVKTEKSPEFDNLAADKLVLRKVDVDDERSEELSARKKIRDVFLETTEQETI